jgi:putative ABC transport system permease protein
MNGLMQDLRYALRQLRKAPGFTLTAVLTLALGIGANTAIFSLLDQALLRSLPVRDPQRLVVLQGTGTAWNGSIHTHGGAVEAYFSYPMYKDLRDHNQAFDGLITTAPANIGIARNGVSQLGTAELVSGNYFTVLGVKPALGRLFTQAEDTQPDANPIVVLSFDFWRDHLGADGRIVGSDVSINGQPFHVVGVAAAGFHSAIWGETPSIFVPMSMMNEVIPGQGKRLIKRSDRSMNIIGRLKAGESRAQAEASLAPLWHALRADELKAFGIHSKHFTDDFLTRSRLLVLPGANGFSYQREDLQKPLLAVMAMAILVLLIASVNVASLLLVRSAGRAREFAVRYALGAGFVRIVRQLLLEGLLIGAGGGLAGMLLAPFAIRALVQQLAGDQNSVAFNSSIDARLLITNFGIALVVSILFSLAPAMQLRRLDINASMGQKSSTGTSAMLGFRRAVVGLQIGISVLLLVGAGLFVRTMQNLRHVDVGFTTSHLITFGIDPRFAGYAAAAIPALHQRVIDALAAIPGVQAVAATNDPDLSGDNHGGNVTVAGYTPPPDDDFDVEVPEVSPTYFSVLHVPLLMGRMFTDGDTIDHPRVAIINEAFARHFCGTPAACLGRMMAAGGGNGVKLDTEIVGIVRDYKHAGVRDDARPTYFRPIKQDPAASAMSFYIRTFNDPAQMLTTVRSAMQQLDPSLALDGLRTMEVQIDDQLSNERMVSLLAISFGILTTLLAGIGLYGVLAYSTAQRTQEIGIRIALGSTRLAISRIVLGDVLRLAGIGITVALPVSYGLSRLLRSQLFGVSPADPLTIAGAVALISIVTLLAALAPARRAASVDPMQALRAE